MGTEQCAVVLSSVVSLVFLNLSVMGMCVCVGGLNHAKPCSNASQGQKVCMKSEVHAPSSSCYHVSCIALQAFMSCEAEVCVPKQRNAVGKKRLVFQRHAGEVDYLRARCCAVLRGDVCWWVVLRGIVW